MNIKCGKCKSTHPTVSAVRVCYGQPASTTTVSEAYTGRTQANVNPVAATSDPFGEPVVVNAATEKQVAFILKLATERDQKVSVEGLSKGAASKEISRLLDMPKSARTFSSAGSEPADGIYYVENSNEIFKVYKMVHGSGRQGVKRLDIAEDQTGSFTYLGLASRKLPTAATLMTLEAAKAFGRIYGFCVRCGATLTDEGSIADGIGPICAGKGW